MKKILMAVLVMVAVVGVFMAKGAMAQVDVLISPSVWVLGTKAIEEVTIHVAYPYSGVSEVSVAISATDGTEYTVDASKYPDNRGELVVKFTPDMTKHAVGDEVDVTLNVVTNEEVTNVYEMQVLVKEAGVLTAPIK